MMHFTIKYLVITLFLVQCQSNEIERVSFLEGTWKVENKEAYEVWEKVNPTSFTGMSYKISNGKKQISEYLKLEFKNNELIYSAKVLNQNNQKEIAFVLNKSIDSKFSFENLDHDFPKKIQYTFTNKNKLFVEVKGENDNGFSFYLLRIEE